MSARRTGIIHVHSDYSRDGVDSLERLREVSLERGIAFVGLTDHAEDFTQARWADYESHCRRLSDERLVLVPGLEYRFARATGLHLLALGLRRWIEPATPADFIRETRGIAVLTVVAHPVLASYQIPDEVRKGIDAIEVWNAAYNTRYLPDPEAVRILQEIRISRPEVVGTAGLDQHDCSNDRETRVTVEGDGDPIALLRAGRFVNSGRTMRFDATVGWGPIRLHALATMRWALDLIERAQERLARGRPGGLRTACRSGGSESCT